MQALNLPYARAADLALAYPAMLKFSPAKLAAQVHALRQLLPLEDKQVRVCTRKRLLRYRLLALLFGEGAPLSQKGVLLWLWRRPFAAPKNVGIKAAMP